MNYICTLCGYVYKNAVGDTENGIAPGTDFEGMTMSFFSVRAAACSAARMMFLLLGNTNTTSAGTLSTALRMFSVEGFMV